MAEKDGKKLEAVVAQTRFWCDRLSLPVVVVDFDSLKVIYANSHCEELIGKTQKTLRGKNWSQLFDPHAAETLHSVVDIYSNNFDAFAPTEYNLRILRRSGRSVPVVCSFSGMTIDNHKVLLLSLFDQSKDLKEREALTEDLKTVYQMSKIADLGRISASIAHEINNPLMVIQGQAEILELKASRNPLSSADITKILQPIYRSIERIGRIIGQMKSTNPGGKKPTEVKAMDFTSLLRDCVSLVEQKVQMMGGVVELHLTPELLVQGDQEQLEQVILNLLNNAVEAMEAWVSQEKPPRLKIEARSQDGFVVIEFWNDGNPIPSEQQESIMSPFFSTKELGKGIGMGLAVSAGIVRSHRGNLKLKYSNDQGTCFELKIPMISDQRDQRSRFKVLIVDDEHFVRRVLAERLEGEGYEVVMAVNGQDALDKLIHHPDIAVIFTDLRMPVMDGIKLIAQVRSLLQDVIVVVVSSFLDQLKEGIEKNQIVVDEVLEKPFTHQEFLQVVSSIEKKYQERLKLAAAA